MFSSACQLEGATSIEALTGTKADVSNLMAFRCTAYVKVPRQLRGNRFANQAQKGMMVGYIGVAYRALIPEIGRNMVFRDVRTMENIIKREFIEQRFESDELEPDQTGDDQVDPSPKPERKHLAPNMQDQMEAIINYLNLRRSARVTQEPDHYEKRMIAADSCLLNDSRSNKKVRDRPDNKK